MKVLFKDDVWPTENNRHSKHKNKTIGQVVEEYKQRGTPLSKLKQHFDQWFGRTYCLSDEVFK